MRTNTTTVLAVLLAGGLAVDVARADVAADILKDAGVTGGLIVHVGCGGGEVTAALRAGEGYLVQGLDTSAKNVAQTRALLAEKHLAGKVSARVFDGAHLPYRDNLVNLIVVSDAKCKVAPAEIRRILAPGGVVWRDGKPEVKPRPATFDVWTHYQHDVQGTMVSKDQSLDLLHGIQWQGGPKWLRNHDFMSSMHAMVTDGTRVYYVIDEGLRKHIFLPSKWMLIARDAFNGTVLWRRPLADWYPNNWPLKSGPGQFPRRLVTANNRVYVTPSQTGPLLAVDAATGKLIRTYKGTKATEEILCDDGVLYLLVNPGRKPVTYRAAGTSYKEIGRASSAWAWSPQGSTQRVVALSAESGKVLWEHPSPVAPLSLTLSAEKVFFANGSGLVALDRSTGKELWVSRGPAVKKVPTGGAIRSVYSDGVLVFADGVKMTALSAKDGRFLWKNTLLHSSHHCPNDLFLIDGLIWSANTGTAQKTGTHLKAVDLQTGEVKQDFRASNLPAFPMHPRCYPSRATTKFLLLNGMGTEFYRLGGKKVVIHHTVRGSCVYGVMPANGLLYKPPDSCACYYQSKLEYFCAMAPRSALTERTPEKDRLEKGPAYAKAGALEGAKPAPRGWPMYRCDAERSGHAASAVPSNVSEKWCVELGGKLTQPVVANGNVFVSAVDQQTLYALDAGSGKVAWKFLAAGRIDSPPAVYGKTVLFGCGDGWVYCLDAEDGALAWRYLVAPADRQTVSQQQVESVWPVSGSVLVLGKTVYALAGRNMFFDGGLRLVRLNAATGKLISENLMDEKDPKTGKNLQTLITAKYMPIANPDIFSSDGQRLYMQEQNFTLDGKRIGIAPTLPPRGTAAGERRHLFCQTGLLDNIWFHRSYWIYGADCGEGWGAYANTRRTTPCGRLLAFGKKRIYGFRADQLGNMLQPRASYTLYAADKDPAATPPAPAPRPKAKAKAKAPKAKPGKAKANPRRTRPRRTRARSTLVYHWQVENPGLMVNAMVLTPNALILAGPPDVADETKMLGFLPGADDAINRQLIAQNEAWQGKRGGLLRMVSLEDGKTISTCKTDSIPVFDGMSSAGGALYLSLTNGRVACYGGE